MFIFMISQYKVGILLELIAQLSKALRRLQIQQSLCSVNIFAENH
jgi:hypothetical protein